MDRHEVENRHTHRLEPSQLICDSLKISRCREISDIHLIDDSILGPCWICWMWWIQGSRWVGVDPSIARTQPNLGLQVGHCCKTICSDIFIPRVFLMDDEADRFHCPWVGDGCHTSITVRACEFEVGTHLTLRVLPRPHHPMRAVCILRTVVQSQCRDDFVGRDNRWAFHWSC